MPSDRADIAADLYLKRGARDAAHRCDANTRLGDFDLGATIVAALDLRPGDTVLDVGCGSGGHLGGLAAAVGPAGRAEGFDIAEDAVAATRGRGLQARVADAAQLPVAAGCAQGIACIFAIYYHPDLSATVREFARVTAPGARVVVAGPGMGTNHELYEFHRRATGAEPSDADRIAWGYVDDRVRPALIEEGFERVHVARYENRIRFPDGRAFLDYWVATSLFARTPGADRAQGEAVLDDPSSPITVTKHVDVLTAHAR